MFKRKQKMENGAALSLPRPVSSPTIHNHAPSEAGRIFAWAIVYFVGGIIGWFFLLYLVEEMGYRNPVRVIAYWLFGSVGLIVLSIAVYNGVTRILIKYWDYQLQVEEIRAETARSLSLMAAQPRPGESRLTDEDSKFAALLRIVMDEAYRHIYRNPNEVNQYTKGDTKPWSRTPNHKRQIPGFSEGVSFEMAGKVREWLTKEGVIRRDEVNLERYPTFKHFESLLEEKFYIPIQVNSTLSPIVLQGGGIIEK